MKTFILMMASFMAAVALSIDAMLPALQVIGADLRVANPNHTQYILVSIFAGMAVGQLICGPLSDAVGRKKVLYAGLGLYALGSLVSMLAPSMDVMLLGRILQGLGVAGPYVSAVAIVRDKYSGRDMARIMSLIMMIFVLVPSVAPALGQGILFILSWRYIFALLLLVAAALCVWVYTGLEETLPPEKRIRLSLTDMRAGFRAVFANHVTAGYMICMGLTFGGFMGYLNSTRQIFQDQFQTGTMFSAYFGGLALIFGAASLFNAHIVARLGMRRLCRAAMIIIVTASALFLGWCHYFGETLWPFLIYAAALYGCLALLFGNLNAIAMEPMGHIAGIAAAVIGAVSSVISLLAGTLIGQLYDGTLRPVTIGFLAMSILSLLVMRQVEHKDKEPLPAA